MKKVFAIVAITILSSLAFGADYTNILQQNEEAVQTVGKAISPWAKTFIGLMPPVAALLGLVFFAKFQMQKAEQNHEGKFKVIIYSILAAVAAAVSVAAILGLLLGFATGDAAAGTTIMNNFWKEILGI